MNNTPKTKKRSRLTLAERLVSLDRSIALHESRLEAARAARRAIIVAEEERGRAALEAVKQARETDTHTNAGD